MKVTLANLLEYAYRNHLDCDGDVFSIISRYISDARKPEKHENLLNVIRGTKSSPGITDIRETPFGANTEYSIQDTLDLFNT